MTQTRNGLAEQVIRYTDFSQLSYILTFRGHKAHCRNKCLTPIPLSISSMKPFIFSCLYIWIDSKPIVWGSYEVFTNNSDYLALSLTRFLLNNYAYPVQCQSIIYKVNFLTLYSVSFEDPCIQQYLLFQNNQLTIKVYSVYLFDRKIQCTQVQL